MPHHAPTLGLDFGTTNTVGALIGADGAVAPLAFRDGAATEGVFRSALNFWTEQRTTGLTHCVEGGPYAIARFIQSPEGCRFLQSFKTFAASPSFRSTNVHGRSYRFEDLLAAFLERMTAHRADAAPLPRRLVAGRPVSYAGVAPDPVLAEGRYDAAFRAAGFDEIHYVYEPVAAAFYFAQGLTRDATVLVADFGGGTSDFSIVHFALRADGIHAEPLAQTGVGLAGDRFDYRIIDAVISPRLGKGSTYRSFGKVLEIPGHYYTNFARWNQLAIMKSPEVLRELRQLARWSDDPEPLETLVEVIEEDLGYPLYKAVSDTKMALSHGDSAPLSFHGGGLDVETRVARSDFEAWIADDLARIDESLEAALAAANLTPSQVDRVFLTGGTSFVPALRRRFEARFGAAKVETGDQFLSIAYGLALIGQQDDPSRWTVSETRMQTV